MAENKNKEKPEYTCEPCNFKTLRHYDIESFYKSKLHERNGQPKTTKCNECDYNATTHWLVVKHKIVNHSTIEERQKQKYYCKICDVVFFSPLYRDAHLHSNKHKKYVHS